MKIIVQDDGVMQVDVDRSMAELVKRDKNGERLDDREWRTPEVALDNTPYEGMNALSIEIGGVSVAETYITDLYPAVKAFYDAYKADLEHQRLMQ